MVITLSFLLFVGSIGIYFVMPKGAVDNSSADYIQTNLNFPNDTPIGKVKLNALKLEKFILKQKEVGIVVTNAIVLLDRIKQNGQKMIIRDAIVEASAIRMRPILMTAVATISAMLPLLFKEAETGNLVSQSLAIVVIGGLSIATLLTLVVIPVIYEMFHFKKSKKQRLQQQSSNNLTM